MMRLLLLLFPLIFQYWDESPSVQSMRFHVEEICLAVNEGRAPGSEGEKYVASYIYDVMKDAGLDMLTTREGDAFGLKQDSGDTLISRNVMGYVPGYDKDLRKHYIVVGARMDGLGSNILTIDGEKSEQIYTGANGNASGLAVMLELASMMVQNSISLKRSVIFVAFGASTSSFAGSWNFLHNTFGKDMKNIDAMVNLDILGIDREGMMAFTSGNGDLNFMIDAVSSSLQPIKPRLISQEPYPSDHQVFYAEEIPSVLFTSGRYPEHNTIKDSPLLLDYEFMEREKEYIFNFILELAGAAPGVPSFYNTTSTSESSNSEVLSWSDCDVPPMFSNNPEPTAFLRKWVYPYLKYPQSCINDGIQGRVMVEFIIGEDGKLKNAHVTRSVDPELDAAALKVVNASPKWRAARVKGKKVACSMTIPVEFKLKKKKNR